MKFASRSRWLFSAQIDSALFLGPTLLALLGVTFLHFFPGLDAVRLRWLALALILFSDKGHVFVSAFRTYLDPVEFRSRRTFYLLIPIFYWATAAALYSWNPTFFWCAIVYLGLFHAVRQQYGWMMYTHSPDISPLEKSLDRAFIYAACFLPLLIMHSSQAFSFVPGDMFSLPAEWAIYFKSAFVAVLIGFFAYAMVLGPSLHLPKILIFYSSAICFYGYFAYFGSPFVIAVQPLLHGLPYLVLVYRRQQGISRILPVNGWPVFCAIVLAGGFLEISLTSGFLFSTREVHPWSVLGKIALPEWILPLLVPVITFPAVFHFITDGFLWRRSKYSILKPAVASSSP